MKNEIPLRWLVLLSLNIFILLSACQPATPTPAPTSQPTPTITPTPGPQVMEIQTLLENCETLDEQNATVVLTGKVDLPARTIYGYKGWYGMDLVSSKRVAALFQVGTGLNTMDDLPQYFFQQNLIIRDSAGRIVRHGHEVRVTGRPKYRADSESRRCEIYVDQVDSLMPGDVLVPKDLTIAELWNRDNRDECNILEFSMQFVRLHGELRVDSYSSICQLGQCKVDFVDTTGKGTAKILEGEGPNHMAALPDPFSNQDLKVWDKNGELIENRNVTLVGVMHVSEAQTKPPICEMIVYEVEPGE